MKKRKFTVCVFQLVEVCADDEDEAVDRAMLEDISPEHYSIVHSTPIADNENNPENN